MSELAKKYQSLITLLVIVTGLSMSWAHLDAQVTVALEEKSEIVRELRLIREEIVNLKIQVAVANQKLLDHID